MFKKFFIFLIALLFLILLSSCVKQTQTEVTEVDEKITNEEHNIKEENISQKPVIHPKYTGELITDGIYGEQGILYFVPDKESKELIKINFPSHDITSSIQLYYNNKEIVKDLPTELGIYKVEIDPFILVIDETITEDVSNKFPEEIQEDGPNDMSGKGTYYVIGRKNFSKIKLLHPYIYSYSFETSSEQEKQNKFNLTSDGYNCITRKIELPHKLECNFYTGSDKSEDSIGITKDFATFIDGNSTRTVFIGQQFLGMKVEHIFIKNVLRDNNEEPSFRNIVQFSGETTITGDLSYSFDTGFINNYVAVFSPDEESLKLLPRLLGDDRNGSFVLNNENLKELFGTEEFNKKCKITIKNYNIAYA